jgi:hypothetical protein
MLRAVLGCLLMTPLVRASTPSGEPKVGRRENIDVEFPEAERIRVVLDDLSTHFPGSLHQAFPPHEARRVLRLLRNYGPRKYGPTSLGLMLLVLLRHEFRCLFWAAIGAMQNGACG